MNALNGDGKTERAREISIRISNACQRMNAALVAPAYAALGRLDLDEALRGLQRIEMLERQFVDPGVVHVSVAAALAEELAGDWSEPMQILLRPREDGVWEMLVRRPERAA